MLTDSSLLELISCPKQLDQRLPKMIVKNRSKRCDIKCSSLDSQYHFTIYLRQSSDFIEDFSVGLIWTNACDGDKTLPACILLRCQGPHDGRSEIGLDLHHSYHTHTLSATDIAEHRYIKPSIRRPSDNFASFEEAIYYFSEHCGIISLRDILPPNPDSQLTLF